MSPPATASCERHRDLVARALHEAADEETLEAYAREVPDCQDCRRALASELVVHPALLAGDQGVKGMSALRRALVAPPSPRSSPGLVGALMAPVSARGQRLAVGVLALAIAAGTLWVAASWQLGQARIERARGAPPATMAHSPPPMRPPPPVDPIPVEAPVLAAPSPKVAAQAPSSPAPEVVAPPPRDDGIAEADWPPPPYEDLARGGAKGATSAVRTVQLVLTGGHRVGDTIGLVAVASAETELAVCVDGPERGVVWRGAVPAGRTDLRRGPDLASFAFAAPGSYRFTLSTSDLAGCRAPVHVVGVEVSP